MNMKIINIQPSFILKYNTSCPTNSKQASQLPAQSYENKLPTTAQYLAFMGGYSLDLAQTVKQLDKFAEKNSKIYPPNIREWLGLVLEEGNKAKETLIGVHKKYFASLKKDFISLDEIKRNFREFEDVLPAERIKASSGSFIDKFQKGELEYFDNDEDLSVQLIRLYWGEGFSLSDLKRYTDGLDLYHTMKKLNIPRVSKEYGHILKFSDPQYNERLTREMTEKRLAAMDRRAQMQDGEPVYIKRGPLSAEHKQHISEGNKKFWEENPERIYEMSERQKEFYRQNPERKEDFSRVLSKAWNIFGADRIKNAMSKFFLSKKVSLIDFENPLEMTKSQTKTLREFWGLNDWARKMFSKNMKHAWKKVKEENETVFIIKTVPDKLKHFVEIKAGLAENSLDVNSRYNPFLKTSSLDERSNEIFKQYSDIDNIANVMADTFQISLFRIADRYAKLSKHKPSRIEQEFELLTKGLIYTNTTKNGYKVQTTEEARNDFVKLACLAAESKNEKLIEIVNTSLEEAFDMACKFHNFILK